MADVRTVISLAEGWEFCARGVRKLINLINGTDGEAAFDSAEYMNLYSNVYNLCTQKPPHDFSEALYDRYNTVFREYLEQKVLPGLRAAHGDFRLRETLRRWGDQKVMSRWMKRFFGYLDRYYIPRHNLPNLEAAGMRCFYDAVYMPTRSDVRDATVAVLERERAGDQVDRALVKAVVEMLFEIGATAYEHDFEPAVLHAASLFYSNQAGVWVQECTCRDFMLRADAALGREKHRASECLPASTWPKMLLVFDRDVLGAHYVHLLSQEGSGCDSMMREERVDDLERICRLLARVEGGLDFVSASFGRHIKGVCSDLARLSEQATADADQTFVRSMVEAHGKFMGYVQGCFNNDVRFYKVMKESFESVCNRTVAGVTVAEALANYADAVMLRSDRMSEAELDAALEGCVSMVGYVTDKDVFAEFCRKRMARRLLADRAAGEDPSRILLAKLKHQNGAQFTARMEGMLMDMVTGRELGAEFDAWLVGKPKPPVDISVAVLNSHTWPTYKFKHLNLPACMAESAEVFRSFYETRAKERRLMWIYAVGTCTVAARFDAKRMDLVLVAAQAALLMLFNDAESLTRADICAALGMEPAEVARCLASLSGGQYKMLLCDGDVFRVNAGFTHTNRRIRIKMPQMDEAKKVAEVVDNDRRYAIEASIVRIMKSRKTITHSALVVEVTAQLRATFAVKVQDIKKRVEHLIRGDYMERDPATQGVYRYLA